MCRLTNLTAQMTKVELHWVGPKLIHKLISVCLHFCEQLLHGFRVRAPLYVIIWILAATIQTGSD